MRWCMKNTSLVHHIQDLRALSTSGSHLTNCVPGLCSGVPYTPTHWSSMSQAKPVVISGALHLPLPCLARHGRHCFSQANTHSCFLLTNKVLGLGAAKGPGQLKACSFPSCFAVAVVQCSEQM